MAKLIDEAKGYESHAVNCVECGKKLNDFRSIRCKFCFKVYFKEYSKFGLEQKGEKNGMWKGNKVSYRGIHCWLRRNKPKSPKCEFCNKIKKLDIAKISEGKYTRNFEDYKWLCRKCHNILDETDKNLIYNQIRKEVKS